MSERNPSLLFADMLDAIQAIYEFTEGISFEEFVNDRKTRDAVIRNLQVLGEAANRIPKEIRENYSEIEWTKIIRSRHVIVHDYAGIDYEIVWRIIEVYLPPLSISLKSILGNF